MAENKIEDVAKLLGVELGEEFRIEHLSTKYKLSKGGLKYWSGSPKKWNGSGLLEDLIIGTLTIIKISKPILDDIEKEYLSNFIKPYRKYVKYIKKSSYKVNERITICYHEYVGNCTLGFSLPSFEKGTMYKGMKVDKRYTLEELGL